MHIKSTDCTCRLYYSLFCSMEDVSNPSVLLSSGYFASSTAEEILRDSSNAATDSQRAKYSKTDDPSFMLAEEKLKKRDATTMACSTMGQIQMNQMTHKSSERCSQ